MNDGQRQYPVDYFFLHHSTGPDFTNASDMEVQDWYSNTGKARAYSNGAINSNHEHPSRPGTQTYAQAQFTLREYTLDGNKYGFRLTDLFNNPWGNVAWAVGNWDYNIKSCSVEICGNFLDKILPLKALMLLADFLREIDQELVNGGCLGGINVWLHQEVYSTACPARIKEQRDNLVDMINNPDGWNARLFPATLPIHTPVVTTKTEYKTEPIAFTKKTIKDAIKPINSIVVVPGANGVKTFSYSVTYTDGKETARTLTGESITTQPIDELTTIGTYVEPVIPPVNEDVELPTSYIKKNLWQIILSMIKSFVEALKGNK